MPNAHANHLIDSTSPYLLQHAHNPVDWYPWAPEALQRARREDKPIFLSIGYAACHWCHVMERESFENPAIAAQMNQHFINIKVDREERPDLDELYMLATQLMTGGGGWPMSVWLTPELRPFYAGTYFPPADGFGRPGFLRLLAALAEAWRNRRGELIAQAQRVVEAIGLHADETAGDPPVAGEDQPPAIDWRPWLRSAIEQMADRFDEVNGGLGGAPKFPPHQALQLWIALLTDTGEAAPRILSGPERHILTAKLTRTLDAMMRGGIYDHVGGGFARYSTDEKWRVPHFEKMLYDSAQLAPLYAAASVLLENPDYARIARHTLGFFLREMRSPEGAFYSSLDADSQGAEGRFYVWTPADIRAALPEKDDADLVMEHLGVTVEGNWAESPLPGASVLAVSRSIESLAQRWEVTPQVMRQRIDRLLEVLRAARAQRAGPGVDDKILTGWNGLMLSGLAVVGGVLKDSGLVAAAQRLADCLLTRHCVDGRLLRVSRGTGAAHTPAFLDDHAFVLNGLLDLAQATASDGAAGPAALERACLIADLLLEEFEDSARGGFFFTGPRHETLFVRMKNAADNATPSANGVAIRALLRLAAVTGESRYRRAALRAVGAFRAAIERRAEYFPTILLALLENPPPEKDDLRPGAAAVGAPAAADSILSLSVDPPAPVKPGEELAIVLRLTIAPGYHIQPVRPRDARVYETVARIRDDAGVLASQEWDYPAGIDIDGHDGYAGKIAMNARCRVSPGALHGLYTLRGVVIAQPCRGDACLSPQPVAAEFVLHVQSA